ncbi:hypothetical protein [Methylotenera versatilis]|jgi:hypothetical protein|uniref:Uncharacterized protein n=1 Tax=Methylotenera versatilis (strain 301) TaxID=666681 RepID=D7DNH9_METV0|nr:hypothetical protein [Methylotenera versatilis]ADI30980.1 conserved hypothetical protein [Methylotenera versatilis 301]
MKKVLLVLSALFAFSAISAYADEALPEIAPVDEVAVPPLDTPAADDGK